jgi:hypothetical protein
MQRWPDGWIDLRIVAPAKFLSTPALHTIAGLLSPHIKQAVVFLYFFAFTTPY